MTAINCFVRDDGVFFVTDGMTYAEAGDLVMRGRVAKIHSLPWLNAAFAATGSAMAGTLIAFRVGDAPVETFDDLTERFSVLMSSAAAELRALGQAFLDNCEVVLAGWSEARESYEAYALATYSYNGHAPFTLRPVTKYTRPYPPALISATFDPAHAERDGMRILQAQRDAPSEEINGKAAGRAVGAFGQCGHLTREGLTLRCIGRWPES